MRTAPPCHIAMLLSLICGCNSSNDLPASYATPEECFAGIMAASIAGDRQTIEMAMAKRDREIRIGQMSCVSQRFPHPDPQVQAATDAVLRKHGLSNLEEIGALQLYDAPGADGATEALRLVGNRVQNHNQFFADFAEAKPAKPADIYKLRTLSDVKISESHATGTQFHDGKDIGEIHFVKEFGSWRMTLYRDE